jgi:hypothetical protein
MNVIKNMFVLLNFWEMTENSHKNISRLTTRMADPRKMELNILCPGHTHSWTANVILIRYRWQDLCCNTVLTGAHLAQLWFKAEHFLWESREPTSKSSTCSLLDRLGSIRKSPELSNRRHTWDLKLPWWWRFILFFFFRLYNHIIW